MPVAPSFKGFPQVSEPFIKKGKNYIKVKNEKTGTIREVRLYSEEEFSKLFLKKKKDEGFKNLKKCRGFSTGPITVIRGNKQEDEYWLGKSNARLAEGIGWYFISTESIPLDIPKHFNLIELTWEEFKDGDNSHMKSPEELAKIISEKEGKPQDEVQY